MYCVRIHAILDLRIPFGVEHALNRRRSLVFLSRARFLVDFVPTIEIVFFLVHFLADVIVWSLEFFVILLLALSDSSVFLFERRL